MMATPYLPYWVTQGETDTTESGQLQFDRDKAEAAKVEQRDLENLRDTYASNQKELNRMDIATARLRRDQRRDLLKAQTDVMATTGRIVNSLAGLQGNALEAAARAAASKLDSLADSFTRMTQAEYTAPPQLLKYIDQGLLISNTEGMAGLVGAFDEVERTYGSAAYPSFINTVYRKVGAPQINLGSSDAEVTAALRSKGIRTDIIDKMLGLHRRGQAIEQGIRASQDALTVAKAKTEGVIGKALGDANEAQRARNELIDHLRTMEGQLSAVANASPEAITALIQEDDREIANYETLRDRTDELWEMITGRKRAPDSMSLLGMMLDDDAFKLWARDNGLPDIGEPVKNKEGDIIGAVPGKDLAWAWQRYQYQQRNPGQWGRVFARGKGQVTGELVEVKYIPADAAVAGVDPRGRTVVKFGEEVYVEDADGNMRRVHADSIGYVDYQVIGKMDEAGNVSALTKADMATPGIGNSIVKPSHEGETAEFRREYEQTAYGERESMQANLLTKYGEQGYVAVIDENGKRIEIPGTQLPVVRRISMKEDESPAEMRRAKRALRLAASGRLLTTDDMGAVDGPSQYKFGGVDIRDGGESEQDKRIAERFAKRLASDDPIDRSLDLPSGGSALDAAAADSSLPDKPQTGGVVPASPASGDTPTAETPLPHLDLGEETISVGRVPEVDEETGIRVTPIKAPEAAGTSNLVGSAPSRTGIGTIREAYEAHKRKTLAPDVGAKFVDPVKEDTLRSEGVIEPPAPDPALVTKESAARAKIAERALERAKSLIASEKKKPAETTTPAE